MDKHLLNAVMINIPLDNIVNDPDLLELFNDSRKLNISPRANPGIYRSRKEYAKQ